MHPRQYAQALFALGQKPKADAKALAKGLKETLKRRGHLALAPRIAAELSRVERQARSNALLRVVIADPSVKKEAVATAERLASRFSRVPLNLEVTEDESLIAGFAVEGPGFRFDSSSRAALIELYRTLIKN